MLRALSAALPRSQRPCRRLCLSSSPSRISLWMEGAEMVRRQALFLGDSELQQLLHIFRKAVKLLTPGGNMLELRHELRLPFVNRVITNQVKI
ncbi:cyclin-dependent kinase B2-1-like isoform X3 [Magnolia sinica]|uniref:cyclin-dependent kinase B2-1-like isoform X3 n=1 Tax=Magnolia sinica TaxID=86752 RepID=UPI002659F0BA|nr:cyclin-dependent kinase B2-1-like isoform X3 [Magnolia sinica]XP_058070845.1 cyclin-dependent kinase B2-1-like isoform X3 [Magnolia sinica]XP_058070846.1 cyclin-dependent kinase B2-1-like isoform X3 [Magnolia sinica]